MEIFGGSERAHELVVLVDHPDAMSEAVSRGAERDWLPSNQEPARIRMAGAAQDAHERRLPGAVLAEDGMHFSCDQVEVHAGESDDLVETLGDVVELEDWVGQQIRLKRGRGGLCAPAA